MRKKSQRSNRTAGFVALVGAGIFAAGGVLPWIVFKGPDVSIGIKDIIDLTPNTDVSAGGLSDGGPQILAAAGVAALVALLLIGTHRRRGILCRVVLLMGGATMALFGAFCIWYAQTALDRITPEGNNALEQALHKMVTFGISRISEVEPGRGAYAMAVGGVLVAVGALIPGRQEAPPQVIYLETAAGQAVPQQREGTVDLDADEDRRRV